MRANKLFLLPSFSPFCLYPIQDKILSMNPRLDVIIDQIQGLQCDVLKSQNVSPQRNLIVPCPCLWWPDCEPNSVTHFSHLETFFALILALRMEVKAVDTLAVFSFLSPSWEAAYSYTQEIQFLPHSAVFCPLGVQRRTLCQHPAISMQTRDHVLQFLWYHLGRKRLSTQFRFSMTSQNVGKIC